MRLAAGLINKWNLATGLAGVAAVLSVCHAAYLWWSGPGASVTARLADPKIWSADLLAVLIVLVFLYLARAAERQSASPDSPGVSHRLPDLVAQRHAERIGRIGIWYWVLETDEIVWSDEAHRLLGLTPGDIMPRWAEFLRMVHPEDQDAVHQWFRRAWKTDLENVTECRIVLPDGTIRWVEAREGPFFEDGKKTAIFGTLMDVTERVESFEEIQLLNQHQEKLVAQRTAELQFEIAKREDIQAELELSEATHRNIVDSAAEAIVTVDTDGTILSANKAVESIFGYEPDDLVGRPVGMLMEPSIAGKHNELIDNYLRTGKSRLVDATTELAAQRADGGIFPIELSLTEVSVPGRKFFCAIVRDVSQRKAAEQELRKSAARLRASERNLKQLLDLSPVGITIIDSDKHKRIYANKEMAKMLMIPEDLPVEEWPIDSSFADPEDAGSIRNAGIGKSPLSDLELLRKRSDGSTWWCLHNSRPINFAGQDAAIVWHLDISNRKRIEAELSRKEEQLRSTIENAPAGIILTDKDQNIVLINEALKNIVSVPDELTEPGKSYCDVLRYIAERGDFGTVNTERKYLNAVEGLLTPTGRNYEYASPSGRVYSVRRHAIADGGVVTVAADVTAQKENEERLQQALWDLELAQDELVQAEKMASLGGLVAGVAHEINTPVGTARTAASHVRTETVRIKEALESNAVKRSHFVSYLKTADEGSRIIENNLGRAAQLISSFKQVAVDQSSEQRRNFNVDAYLRETVESLRPQLKSYPHVELELETDADVSIDSFPGAFAQVLSNLFVNALAHGFGEDGRGLITIRTMVLGAQVRIAFEDDGKGMSAETRDRIFEPFFTTKRGSGGSGLGMHIVYNLVTTQLSGSIRCFSNLDEGTRFDITLPQRPETGE